MHKVKWGTGFAWRAKYTDPATGERRSKQMARKADLVAFLEEIKRPKIAPSGFDASRTIAAICRAWAEAARNIGLNGEEPVEPLTYDSYEGHVRLHIEPVIGDRSALGFTAPDAALFRDELLRTRSRAMARKVFTSFRSALSYAVTLGWIPANPAATVKIAGRSSRAKPKVVIPSRGQIKVLLAKLDELATQPGVRQAKRWRRWRVFVRTSLAAGLRSSELRGMPKALFRPNRAQIEVRQRADKDRRIGAPKSAAGHRTIDLDSGTVTLLREWLVECPPGDYLFPGAGGCIESHANILNRCWYPLLAACGMTEAEFSWHGLRHAHASLLIARGLPPKEVQARMGHSSIAMTMDTYGHLFPEDRDAMREAVAHIGAALDG